VLQFDCNQTQLTFVTTDAPCNISCWVTSNKKWSFLPKIPKSKQKRKHSQIWCGLIPQNLHLKTLNRFLQRRENHKPSQNI